MNEYQDINPIQEEFIRTFAAHLDMLLMVGDDDQSIYSWRGANVQNILTFRDRYNAVSVHRLLINFRSTKAIVDGANEFVQRLLNTQRLDKDIKSNSDGNIQDLRKLWFDKREDEAEWVASRIEELVGTKYVEKVNPDGSEVCRGLTCSDFAILLRSIHNSNGDNRDKDFADALTRISKWPITPTISKATASDIMPLKKTSCLFNCAPLKVWAGGSGISDALFRKTQPRTPPDFSSVAASCPIRLRFREKRIWTSRHRSFFGCFLSERK